MAAAVQTTALQAQTPTGQLIGRVTDADGGQPLALATVQIVEAHRGELTRADGAFVFGQVPVGRYTVIVEQLGYDRHVQQADVTAGATTNLTVALHVRAIPLSEIVVTGALTRRTGEDVMS